MTFKLLSLASLLLLGSALAQEGVPAAPAAVPAKPAAKESWIPHGPGVKLKRDAGLAYVDFMTRMVVEPWRKHGGTEDEVAFLKMYMEVAAGLDEAAEAELPVFAAKVRKESQSPYVRGYAANIVLQTEGGYYSELIGALEAAYDAIAADPQMPEMAKAIIAFRVVRARAERGEPLNRPESREWLKKGETHLLAGWDRKEMVEADQPVLFSILLLLPSDGRQTLSPLTLGGLAKGIEGREASYPWLALIIKARYAQACGWEARGSGTIDTVSPAELMEFRKQIREQERLAREAWRLHPDWSEGARCVMDAGMDIGFPEGETVQEWFGRTVQGKFDDFDVYSKMLWRLRPRWGGSINEMLAFGEACLDTGRFDTDVPLYYVVALNDAGTEMNYSSFRRLYHCPSETNTRLNYLYEERLRHVDDPSLRHLLLAQQACCNVWGGNHEKARQVLAQLPPDYQFGNPFYLRSWSPVWMSCGRQALEDEIEAFSDETFKAQLQSLDREMYLVGNTQQASRMADDLAGAARKAGNLKVWKVAADMLAWSSFSGLGGTRIPVGCTPLHMAVMQSNNTAFVNWAVNRVGYSPDVKGFPSVQFRTPLGVACRNGNAAMARALVGVGADPFLECGGDEPQTPFYDAITRPQNMKVIKALVEAGLERDNKEQFCRNYLKSAWLNREDTEMPLLAYVYEGKLMNPNMVVWEDNGQTLLHAAAAAGSVDTVQLLLRCGADAAAQDAKGRLPADLARNEQVQALLKEAAAKAQKPAAGAAGP